MGHMPYPNDASLEGLLGNYVEDGFHLEATDAHLLILFHGDTKVALFNRFNVSNTAIQAVCFEWLCKQAKLQGKRGVARSHYRRTK